MVEQSLTPEPQQPVVDAPVLGPDHTGEMRSLFIRQFEQSDFPAVLYGRSRYVAATTSAGRRITVERCKAISLRTALDGHTYIVLSDENIDERFMPPRDIAVVGFDATEDGEKITTTTLLRKVAEDFQAFQASLLANGTPAVMAGDDLPL